MEGALRDAGGADLAQAVPQLAPLPTPAPVLHFKHCKDEWDVDDAQGQQLVATMTQSMPGASEATKRGRAEVWEQLVGYPEAELIAALEEAAGDEDMEEEDDDDEEDDLPLALRATAPAGSVASLRRAPRMASAGTQTGGVREAGKVVTADKGATVDAGTLVRRLKVTMPLLKATHVDQGLTDLLLNYLIAATVKQGRTVHVPEGADVLPVPPALYAQERKILAAARVDDYEATEAALQANRERYARRQAGASRRGTTRRRDAGNMVVDKLLRDYVALLDHGLGEAAQEAQAVMATTAIGSSTDACGQPGDARLGHSRSPQLQGTYETVARPVRHPATGGRGTWRGNRGTGRYWRRQVADRPGLCPCHGAPSSPCPRQ